MQVNLLMPIRQQDLIPFNTRTTEAAHFDEHFCYKSGEYLANINQILHIHKSSDLMGLAHGRAPNAINLMLPKLANKEKSTIVVIKLESHVLRSFGI